MIWINGIGAVSPAGWGVPAMREVLARRLPLVSQSIPGPDGARAHHVLNVPAAPPEARMIRHPRLRRASPVTHFIAAAVMEAIGSLPTETAKSASFGLILCLDAGCVQYSCRFFEEVQKDPTTASPLLFPETVFSAPVSHAATLLDKTPLVYTLMGDDANFLQGVALATDWLEEGRVDLAVVAGAEEITWLLADALWQIEHKSPLAAGAGAVLLSNDPRGSNVSLRSITDPHTYSRAVPRGLAASKMRQQLLTGSAREGLFDSQNSSLVASRAERDAWLDWQGNSRVSVRQILGEGLVAAAGWQCVAAIDSVARQEHSSAIVSLVGKHQQAIGAIFEAPVREGN